MTVVEQAIELEPRLPEGGPDLITRLAALLHDIGKPRTRRFAGDGTVTFHHHDVVGAKMTNKRMQALRFSNDDIDAVVATGRAAPAFPRLRLRVSGRTRRCAVTSETRVPSWSGCTC